MATVLSSKSVLPSEGNKHSDDNGLDLTSYENEFLDDLDSYWDDLSARLTVSRMVSEATIKGMVTAIQEETNEKIALKESEVALLNKKLDYYSKQFDFELGSVHCSQDMRKELEYVKKLDRLRIKVEEQLGSVPLSNLVSEQEWREGVQKEICSNMVHDFIKGMQEEFEMSICEQQRAMPMTTINSNWRKGLGEISSIREDLDNMYRSLPNSDSGLLVLHTSNETVEKRNKISGDHVSKIGSNNNLVHNFDLSEKLISNDSPQQKCMTKDELIMYFKSEMSSMKRQYELTLLEKTEELFSFKRHFLNEKGCSPLHFSKEKDFEMIKKKISELIVKLDGILLEGKKMPKVSNDQGILHKTKESVEILMKNQWLQKVLVDKSKEINYEEIERLRLCIEEVKVEATIKEEKYKSYLKDLVNEVEYEKEAAKTVAKIIGDNYSILYRGVIEDTISGLNPIITELNKEKESINTSFLETKQALCLKTEENERLKQEISSFFCQLEKQKEESDLVSQELNLCRDQSIEQTMIFSKTKGELDETCQQIHKQELEISNLNHRLMTASNALEEMERENCILKGSNQEKQENIVSLMKQFKEQKEQLKFILAFMLELSKAMLDFESKFTHKMETNESRLNHLINQCVQIKEHSNKLKNMISWYKGKLEATCQDLQKAENEVDLLADEVETLSGLLEKIHIALDHYSPVLQYYPGVVETLKLIRREMNKETFKSS